jgi:hypothetical protein
MTRVRTVIAAAFATVAIAAIATAVTGGATTRQAASTSPFQAEGSLTPSGNPEPSVVSFPDGTQNDMHWSMCRAHDPGACVPMPSKDGTADPGPEPAGTIFRLIATYQGRTYASSLTWHGTIGIATGPAIHGRTRYDATVTSDAARWTGGWGTEHDQLGIEACRTARGTDCVMLSGDQLQCSPTGCGSLGGVPRLRPNRAQIGNWYTGWYLFALDAHRGNDISELVGYSSPAAIPPWPRNATVARSRPYGPIAGPPAPRVRFLRHAQTPSNQVLVASVACAVTCHAWLTVRRIGKHFTSGERISWSANKKITGSALVGVRGSIAPGPLAVTINVGDGPYLHARTIHR